MNQAGRFSARSLVLMGILCGAISCAQQPRVQEMPLPTHAEARGAPAITGAPTSVLVAGTPQSDTEGGIVETIRSLIEQGSPSSLSSALTLINGGKDLNLSRSEFGRTMNFVIITLFQKLYPDNKAALPSLDPAQNHIYTRIIRAAAQGSFTQPRAASSDYLEYVLPFLAFLPMTADTSAQAALPTLVRAKVLNPDSVLAPYFTGLLYEQGGDLERARAEYDRAYRLADACYPAALGIARVLEARGEAQEASALLQNLASMWPDNMTVKRALAQNYYKDGDWSHAGPVIAEILQRNSQDREFMLMRARVFVEMGQFLQAQVPLDQYALLDTGDVVYLFLRARVQAEGYHNRDAALPYLRAMLHSPLVTEEMMIYATLLLMESSRSEEQDEGRALLSRLLADESPPRSLVELAFQDAIKGKAWEVATTYLDRLLAAERAPRYLMGAYQIAQGQGDKNAALSWARELHAKAPADGDGDLMLATALVDAGAATEAGSFIEERLAHLAGGVMKSRYYHLRSRLRGNEDDALSDLRASIFEDARNRSALISLFELYLNHQDETRALYYLKQALALDPDAPDLQAYKEQYAAQL